MDTAQQPEVSSSLLPARRNYLIIIGGLILAAVIIYALFWINFFGISKTPISQSPTLQKITSPYQKQIDQLDSLVSTVKALPQPLRPNRTEEQFVMDKRNIEVPAQEAKDELSKGDTENARKRLAELKAAVKGLGDPLKGNFIPKEIRDKYDPQGLVLKPTDRVDPAVVDLYLAVASIEINLVAK